MLDVSLKVGGSLFSGVLGHMELARTCCRFVFDETFRLNLSG